MKSYLTSIITGKKQGPDASLIRAGLAPLSWVYSFGLKMYLFPYRTGIRKQTHLCCPVISIGNITTGGVGKTSMTLHICEYLQQMGVQVCVLSRGYRGENEHGSAIVSDYRHVLLDARQAGDEAYMLAKMMAGVPVIVGKDRRVTGSIACRQFQPDVIILDDGMQFYQLHRDMEIALVDATRPFDNGWTFPRGLLREPPGHLQRAHCIVLTNADKVSQEVECSLQAHLRHIAPHAMIVSSFYQPESLRPLNNGHQINAEWLNGKRVGTFCALGNPAAFEKQLQQAGAEVVSSFRLEDHHEPTMQDLNELIQRALSEGAEAIIVTEKDAVKLPPLARPLPFYSLIVRQQVTSPELFFSMIRKTIGKASCS
jgi:tetraacyldisaccharide 4'-kinase